MVGTPKLKPLRIYAGMNLEVFWSNPDASAGAIGKGSKKDNEVECFIAFEKIKTLIKEGVPFSKIQIVALPAHRAQISGFYNTVDYDDFTFIDAVKQKDRLVWVVDGGTNLVEAQYGLPLQDYLSTRVHWYAGGKDPERMRELLFPMSRFGVKWISLDYSGYDQTVPAKVIHDVFKQIVRPMFPEESSDELKFIEYNFIHTQMILPGNMVVVKHRGIPSGSLFTQIIGSLCNALIGLTYLCSRCDGSEEEISGYVQRLITNPRTDQAMLSVMGDDNIWGLNAPIEISDWAEYVEKVFGMRIHADKCASWSNYPYPEYLKRLYTPQGEKMNLLYLVLNVCSPERGQRSYKDYSPWHILWGLFCTYRASFRNAAAAEQLIVMKMQEYGGLEALKALKTHELPGVLRGYSNKAKEMLLHRAKAVERVLKLVS